FLLIAGCAGLGPSGRSSGTPGPGLGPYPPYAAAQLAGIVDFGEVSIAPDGAEVAYTTDRTGAFELWTVALSDGRPGPPRQRTHAGERVSGLSSSPDGRALVFEVDHGGDERPDLWLLRRDAAAPERLTQTPTAERVASFSPDGRAIAFEADGDQPFRFDVYTM